MHRTGLGDNGDDMPRIMGAEGEYLTPTQAVAYLQAEAEGTPESDKPPWWYKPSETIGGQNFIRVPANIFQDDVAFHTGLPQFAMVEGQTYFTDPQTGEVLIPENLWNDIHAYYGGYMGTSTFSRVVGAFLTPGINYATGRTYLDPFRESLAEIRGDTDFSGGPSLSNEQAAMLGVAVVIGGGALSAAGVFGGAAGVAEAGAAAGATEVGAAGVSAWEAAALEAAAWEAAGAETMISWELASAELAAAEGAATALPSAIPAAPPAASTSGLSLPSMSTIAKQAAPLLLKALSKPSGPTAPPPMASRSPSAIGFSPYDPMYGPDLTPGIDNTILYVAGAIGLALLAAVTIGAQRESHSHRHRKG